MIKIEGLTKKISDLTIVDNVNLEIKSGVILGIVGESGAGKSSLIRMINGLMKPSSGTVKILDTSVFDITEKKLRLLRKDIGMIFQNFNLLSQKTVYQNIKLSLDVSGYSKIDSDKRINELLALVGLSLKKETYPKTLSGGEMQRVAIARAIATNPKYLLCDEVTSALDKRTSFEILDLLQKINKLYNVTIVFVSHDLDAIKYLCNEVVVMEKGRIIEQNSTLNLFMNPKTILAKQLVNKKIFDLSKTSNDDIYQITYLDKEAGSPLISLASKKFDININIIYGEVIEINKQSIGFLYVNIKGPDINKALEYIKKEVEVIKYV